MKKSHPLRHRILAARRARRARTLAARRQVEALAALLAYRRLRDRLSARRRLPDFAGMLARLGLNPARIMERILAEQANRERLGIAYLPSSLREISNTVANLRRA